MSLTLAAGLLAALAAGAEPLPADYGYLSQPAFAIDRELRLPLRRYVPQPGDIVMEADDRLFWNIGHKMAGTDFPHHSKVVFRRPDGGLSVVQAGFDTYSPHNVNIRDLRENLLFEEGKTGRLEKRLWVRPRKVPLTEEQSQALAEFALSKDGLRFARIRMALLTTPFRSKGPVRAQWLGKADFDKRNFWCAELVTTTLAYGGVLDPDLVRPSGTFPNDLFFGRSNNYWVNRGLVKLNEEWEPPARWTSRGPE